MICKPLKPDQHGYHIVCYGTDPAPHRVTVFWKDERFADLGAESAPPDKVQEEPEESGPDSEIQQLLARADRLAEKRSDEKV